MDATRLRQFASGFTALCVLNAAPGAELRDSSDGGCASPDIRMLASERIALEPDGSAARKYVVPGGTETLIAVGEAGVDARMEVTSSEAVSGADSPIQWWGPQRVALAPGLARTIEVTALNLDRVAGSVTVQVFTLVAGSGDPCVAALKSLASGDAHYDRARTISTGRRVAEEGTAAREYTLAMADYASAARRFAGHAPTLAQGQAELSSAIGFDLGLNQFSQSVKLGRAAIETFRLVGNDYGRDRARATVADSHAVELKAMQLSAARDQEIGALYAEWADIARSHGARGERFEEARAHNFVGLLFSDENDFPQAIASFTRAINLYDRLKMKKLRAQAQQNLALAEDELTRYAEANTSYRAALGALDEHQDPKLFADITNNLALNEFRVGKVDQALFHYSQALDIFIRIQDPREQARSRNGIGRVYAAVGRAAEALDYFQQALALRSVEIDRFGRIATLRALAELELAAGGHARALQLSNEAYALTNNASRRTLIDIELIHEIAAGGDNAQAEARLQELFSRGFGDEKIAKARALLERARLELATKEFARAEQDARDAAAIFRSLELRNSAFLATLEQARAACGRRDAAALRPLLTTGLSQAEVLRNSSGNPSFRATMWQTHRPMFDLAMRMTATSECGGPAAGDAFAALAISERSRGRALADFRRSAAAASSTPVEQRRRELFDRIAAARARLEYLAADAKPDAKRMKALRAEISDALRKLDIIGAGAARDEGHTITPDDLRRLSETLRPEAAVVEYWLGERASLAWLVTKGRIHMVELGSTERIDVAAREVNAAMRDFTSVSMDERLRRVRVLSQLIIDPLPGEFLQARHVYFIPDGTLHGVPFTALTTAGSVGPNYLAATRDVSVAATLGTVADDDEPINVDAGVQVLLVADPVYSRDDARLANLPLAQNPQPQRAIPTRRGAALAKNAGWTRLEASGREAAAIMKIVSGSRAEMLTGFAANRDALLERDLRGFRILHFATHAVADLESPSLSTLVLSTFTEGGAARTGEVFAGDLLYRPLAAELVVFSGCETALGESTAGEGLFGLRYAAHAAGARTVVASLWPVVDEVGEFLMIEFYAAMTRDHLPPAAALARSMRRARERWHDPAFWSVFEVSRVARSPTLH